MTEADITQLKIDIRAIKHKAENAMKDADKAEKAAKSAMVFAGDCLTLAARLEEYAHR